MKYGSKSLLDHSKFKKHLLDANNEALCGEKGLRVLTHESWYKKPRKDICKKCLKKEKEK